MWVQLIIAIVMLVVSYAIAPRPKQQKTNALKPQDVTTPTVSAGSPIQVVFGRVRVKNPNVLFIGPQRSVGIYK